MNADDSDFYGMCGACGYEAETPANKPGHELLTIEGETYCAFCAVERHPEIAVAPVLLAACKHAYAMFQQSPLSVDGDWLRSGLARELAAAVQAAEPRKAIA